MWMVSLSRRKRGFFFLLEASRKQLFLAPMADKKLVHLPGSVVNVVSVLPRGEGGRGGWMR